MTLHKSIVMLLLVTWFSYRGTVFAKLCNVALCRPTIQGSLFPDTNSTLSASCNAADGILDSNLYHGSCMQTNHVLEPMSWWQVDFGDVYDIVYVNITAREDVLTGYKQISDSEIIIGSTLAGDGRLNDSTRCGSYLGDPVIIQAGVPINMQCATTISGRYLEFIRSVFRDNFVSFCEMEVYANVSTTDCPNPPQDWYCRDLVHTSSNPRVSCVAEAVITTEAVTTTTEALTTTEAVITTEAVTTTEAVITTEAVTTTTEALTTTEPVVTTTEAITTTEPVATTTEAVAATTEDAKTTAEEIITTGSVTTTEEVMTTARKITTEAVTTTPETETTMTDTLSTTTETVSTADVVVTTVTESVYTDTEILSTTYLDVTTSSNPASPTTNNSGQICYCPCDGRYTDLTTAELADKIEKMVADIKIDPKKTSSAKRKLISVTDDRPSAKAIGSLGIVILISVTASIIIMDADIIYKYFEKCKSKRLDEEAEGENSA